VSLGRPGGGAHDMTSLFSSIFSIAYIFHTRHTRPTNIGWHIFTRTPRARALLCFIEGYIEDVPPDGIQARRTGPRSTSCREPLLREACREPPCTARPSERWH
jgi:hypothetical protein